VPTEPDLPPEPDAGTPLLGFEDQHVAGVWHRRDLPGAPNPARRWWSTYAVRRDGFGHTWDEALHYGANPEASLHTTPSPAQYEAVAGALHASNARNEQLRAELAGLDGAELVRQLREQIDALLARIDAGAGRVLAPRDRPHPTVHPAEPGEAAVTEWRPAKGWSVRVVEDPDDPAAPDGVFITSDWMTGNSGDLEFVPNGDVSRLSAALTAAVTTNEQRRAATHPSNVHPLSPPRDGGTTP
jgi:hypothetical protein